MVNIEALGWFLQNTSSYLYFISKKVSILDVIAESRKTIKKNLVIKEVLLKMELTPFFASLASILRDFPPW